MALRTERIEWTVEELGITRMGDALLVIQVYGWPCAVETLTL
jgi:hypothetical protein